MTDLNTTLAKVIATVESGGFPYALRFEDAVYHRPPIWGQATISACLQANKCSGTTGRMILSTSFGLFQIMGFNLYGMLALKIPVATFLFDAEQQLASFAAYCKANGITPEAFDFTNEVALEHFARVYNGPGDIANYVAKMRAAYAALPTT